MSDYDPSIRARKQRLKASNSKKGLVQVQVWVPNDRRDDLYILARSWRQEHDTARNWERKASTLERNT